MADSFPREVYVAGVGMTAFARHEGKRVTDLRQEAVRAAPADAGLEYRAVEIACRQGFGGAAGVHILAA